MVFLVTFSLPWFSFENVKRGFVTHMITGSDEHTVPDRFLVYFSPCSVPHSLQPNQSNRLWANPPSLTLKHTSGLLRPFCLVLHSLPSQTFNNVFVSKNEYGDTTCILPVKGETKYKLNYDTVFLLKNSNSAGQNGRSSLTEQPAETWW